jgi:hypothetical protein
MIVLCWARSDWLFAVAVAQPWSCTVFHYVRLFLSCYVMYCFIGKVYKLNLKIKYIAFHLKMYWILQICNIQNRAYVIQGIDVFRLFRFF